MWGLFCLVAVRTRREAYKCTATSNTMGEIAILSAFVGTWRVERILLHTDRHRDDLWTQLSVDAAIKATLGDVLYRLSTAEPAECKASEGEQAAIRESPQVVLHLWER